MAFRSDVLTIERDGHVATLWLDDPDHHNAMGPTFWHDLPLAMAELSEDIDVRAVVLAGRGQHFTAGLNLATMGGTVLGGEDEGSAVARRLRMLQQIKRMQDAVTAVAECPKPVIAGVHGACIGAGVDLVCACDIRLASADARFSVRETRVAMVADLGTLQRLPKIVGDGHVAEMVYTGKDVGAEHALRIGLVNDVLPDHAAAVAAAQDMAATIAANSPLAVQGSKAMLRAGDGLTVEQSLDRVALWNAAFIQSDDLSEALAAFFEKRSPDFRGH